nr:endoglucanase 14 [Tanacetum cinerariifolium]
MVASKKQNLNFDVVDIDTYIMTLDNVIKKSLVVQQRPGNVLSSGLLMINLAFKRSIDSAKEFICFDSLQYVNSASFVTSAYAAYNLKVSLRCSGNTTRIMRRTLMIILLFTLCDEQVKWNSVLMRLIDDLLALDSIVRFGFSDGRLKQTATFSISTNSE